MGSQYHQIAESQEDHAEEFSERFEGQIPGLASSSFYCSAIRDSRGEAGYLSVILFREHRHSVSER